MCVCGHQRQTQLLLDNNFNEYMRKSPKQSNKGTKSVSLDKLNAGKTDTKQTRNITGRNKNCTDKE